MVLSYKYVCFKGDIKFAVKKFYTELLFLIVLWYNLFD